MTAFHEIGLESLNQVFLDLDFVREDLISVVNGIEGGIVACKALVDEEAVSPCFTELHEVFSIESADILNRVVELAHLGTELLTEEEQSQQDIMTYNNQFIMQGSENIRGELTICIESLQLLENFNQKHEI